MYGELPLEVHVMAGTPADEANPAAQPAADAEIVSALRSVYDPEIPINIYDLGLIYAIERPSPGEVQIRMTLTAPGCPVAGTLPGEVQCAVAAVDGVEQCSVELVWQPAWTRDRMSEEAQLQLGLL